MSSISWIKQTWGSTFAEGTHQPCYTSNRSWHRFHSYQGSFQNWWQSNIRSPLFEVCLLLQCIFQIMTNLQPECKRVKKSLRTHHNFVHREHAGSKGDPAGCCRRYQQGKYSNQGWLSPTQHLPPANQEKARARRSHGGRSGHQKKRNMWTGNPCRESVFSAGSSHQDLLATAWQAFWELEACRNTPLLVGTEGVMWL